MKLVERIVLGLSMFTGDMKSKLAREDGATAVEYGLLVALIAAVIIATVILLGRNINCQFTRILAGLKDDPLPICN